jgi:PAS domain S-box-containing protein
MAPRSRRLRYGVAISSTLLVLALALLLRPLIGPRPLALVLAAVVFSAWYGGFGPGLLATFLGALGGIGYLLADHPAGAGALPDVHARMGMFLVVSVLISGLTGALHAAQERAETNARKLRVSEAWYRRVLDTAYEGIWVTDAQGRTDYVNDRMAEMLGYTVGEMLGRPLFDFMDGAACAEAERSLERRKQGITEQHDFRFRRQDGADLWAIVSTNPILNETGEFAGALAMITDVTERKRLEEALRQRAAALAEADRRKDEFLAMLAHELRNPLAAICSGLYLARISEADEPRRQAALDVVERQVRHQTRLVDDLLDVSRITRGKIVLRCERLDLAWLLRESVQDHRPALEAAGLDLALELPEQAVWVSGDATRLAQVVGNLLQNAAKFTDPGGRVTVRLVAEKQAAITVRDTGMGITPQMLPHLFEPLIQADRTLDRSRGGLGLGLSSWT